jgi:beta-phosphoglucomutase family hydrolase
VVVIDLRDFDAFAVDMDGVVTNTAVVHARAWKRLFDEILADRAGGGPWIPFDPSSDYRRHVDGKARRDGLRSFLASRGIVLPEGTADDSPRMPTIYGLAARKNRYVHDDLAEHGVEVFVDALAFLHRARAAGAKLAIVTASANCTEVLAAAEITGLFDAQVDGVEMQRWRLHGKPMPDTFLEAADRLRTDPRRTVVIEDALAGVAAGRAGGFGLVIGVDRHGDAGSELFAHGADASVPTLDQIELVHTQPMVAAP